MKKILFPAVLTAVILSYMLIACDDIIFKSKENYAQGKVPLITQDENGKFVYFSQLQKVTMTYPTSKLDSVQRLSRLPDVKITYRIVSKDSFSITTFIPSTKILVDMDSLKFIYPPRIKVSVPKHIWWKANDVVALSPKFWIVGKKDDVTNVYTPKGELVSAPVSDMILSYGKEEPLIDDSIN